MDLEIWGLPWNSFDGAPLDLESPWNSVDGVPWYLEVTLEQC